MNKPPLLTLNGVPRAVALSGRVHWIGALDPNLRTFDIILKTANGTSYNAYVMRGSEGVAMIDTVKASFAGDFFARLESVASYDGNQRDCAQSFRARSYGCVTGTDASCATSAIVYFPESAIHAQGLLKQDELQFYAR